MQEQDVVHITPEEIINFILEEMEAGMCPSYYSNLVPSVYEVYLFIDDLERLRPLEQRIRDEAASALGEKLTRLNQVQEPKLTLPFATPKKKRSKRYETLGEWSIEFHENTDDDAKENPLVIHSTFPVANSGSDDRAGTLTERISKRRTDGQVVTTATERGGNVDSRRAAGLIYAELSYQDDTGPHSYPMTNNLIKIGRGAADRWVDLKLQARKDVSREHLQIRRDPATGQFFIKDLSTLGTTVNGHRVPPSISQVNGAELDQNIEVALPERSQIGLAGVLLIDFKAVKQR